MRNLILTTVGDDSLHREWGREQDVALIYFGNYPGRYREDADIYMQRQGFKFPLIAQMLLHLDLGGYDWVWLPDEDVRLNPIAIRYMFDLCRTYDLDLAQPAVEDTQFPILKPIRPPPSHPRKSIFVEMMAPVIKARHLHRLALSFNECQSGWGLDFLWSYLLRSYRIGVLDQVVMVHARPFRGGDLYGVLKSKAINPLAELETLLLKYGLRSLLNEARAPAGLRAGTQAVEFWAPRD